MKPKELIGFLVLCLGVTVLAGWLWIELGKLLASYWVTIGGMTSAVLLLNLLFSGPRKRISRWRKEEGEYVDGHSVSRQIINLALLLAFGIFFVFKAVNNNSYSWFFAVFAGVNFGLTAQSLLDWRRNRLDGQVI